MKKYTLFLFTLSLICFSLFGFNTDSANASNCALGELFNSTTGQACNTASTSVACPAGDIYSSITGQLCTTLLGSTTGSTSGDISAVAVSQFESLFKTSFHIGVSNNDVKLLQQFLKEQGYYSGKVDGRYGAISARAVKDFQDDYNSSNIILPNVPTDTTDARNKGVDASIKANLSNTRVSGELYYNKVGSYISVCSDTYVRDVISAAEKASGLKSICLNSTSSWALSIPLKTNSSASYCVDSSGYIGNGKAVILNGINSCGESQTTLPPVPIIIVPPSTYNQPPVVSVISPNGGESYSVNDTITITWTDQTSRAKTVYVVNSSGTSFYSRSLSINSGRNSEQLDLKAIKTIGQYKIKICDNSNNCDSSDNYFTITSSTTTSACTDSDGGINIDVAGLTDGRVNGIGSYFRDSSVDSNGGQCTGNSCSAVAEGYCSNGAVTNYLYQCPSGYSVNGACTTKPQTTSNYSITVTSPNGGETYNIQKDSADGRSKVYIPITWTLPAAGLINGLVHTKLLQDSNVIYDTGRSGTGIVSISNSGKFTLIVDADYYHITPGSNFKVQIYYPGDQYHPANWADDTSDSSFSIVAS